MCHLRPHHPFLSLLIFTLSSSSLFHCSHTSSALPSILLFLFFSWLLPWKPRFHKTKNLCHRTTTSWTLSMMPHTDPKSLLLEVATGAVLQPSSLPPTPSGFASSMVIFSFSLLSSPSLVLMRQMLKLVSKIADVGWFSPWSCKDVIFGHFSCWCYWMTFVLGLKLWKERNVLLYFQSLLWDFGACVLIGWKFWKMKAWNKWILTSLTFDNFNDS